MTANVNADSNFETLWRHLRVRAPECPVPLAQEFVNTAYSRLLGRYDWSGTRGEGEFYIPDNYDTGTADVTQGSATVLGGSTVWTSLMVGRQFFINGVAPFYTIIDVPDGTTLTLDRVWGGSTATLQSYDILLIYVVLPADFTYFETVRDPFNNWKLHLNFQQEQLDTWDAKRSVSGTTWLLAPASFSPVVTTFGRVRYEMWPKTQPTAKTYLYRYVRKPALFSSATDTPIFPIRGDIILEGALAELALWPGTSSFKNPYHDLNLYKQHSDRFKEYTLQNLREEAELNQQVIRYDDWEGLPYAPIDARYLQTHDVF